MTSQSKHHENKRLLKEYVSFLEECTTYDQKLKLSSEIGRLNSQNKRIEKMSFEDIQIDISNYTIEVNAQLKYIQ